MEQQVTFQQITENHIRVFIDDQYAGFMTRIEKGDPNSKWIVSDVHGNRLTRIGIATFGFTYEEAKLAANLLPTPDPTQPIDPDDLQPGHNLPPDANGLTATVVHAEYKVWVHIERILEVVYSDPDKTEETLYDDIGEPHIFGTFYNLAAARKAAQE